MKQKQTAGSSPQPAGKSDNGDGKPPAAGPAALPATRLPLLLAFAVLFVGILGFALWRLSPRPAPEVKTAPKAAKAPAASGAGGRQAEQAQQNTSSDLLLAAAAVSEQASAIVEAYNAPDAGGAGAKNLLDSQGSNLETALRALRGDCFLPRPEKLDQDMTHLNNLRTLARLLVVLGRSQQRAGDSAAALETYLQVLRLSEVASRNGAVLSGLTGVAIVAGVAPDMERCIAACAADSPPDNLQSALQQVYEHRVEFRDNLGVEWALQEAALGATQVAPGQAIDADGRPVEGEAAPSQGAVASWVMGASRKELGQIMTALTEDAKKPYWERRPEPVEGSRMYSGMLQTLYKAGAKYAQRDALLQGFRVLAAIELWRAKQGSAPRALSELVPRYLEALPEDPFTGDDFIYRVEGKGYRLYSTGPDKEDDDGAARIDSKSQQGDLILWPAGPMSAKAG